MGAGPWSSRSRSEIQYLQGAHGASGTRSGKCHLVVCRSRGFWRVWPSSPLPGLRRRRRANRTSPGLRRSDRGPRPRCRRLDRLRLRRALVGQTGARHPLGTHRRQPARTVRSGVALRGDSGVFIPRLAPPFHINFEVDVTAPGRKAPAEDIVAAARAATASFESRVCTTSLREKRQRAPTHPSLRAEIIRAPSPMSEEMKGYCPRCHTQVVRDNGGCPECGQIDVIPFGLSMPSGASFDTSR